MRRRVVITGAGCITPLGNEPDEFWRALATGQSGVGEISNFDATNFPVRIAAEVQDWEISDIGEDPLDWQHHARQTRFAVAAVVNARESAGLASSESDPIRTGVFLGCGEIFPDFIQLATLMGQSLRGKRFDSEDFAKLATDALHAEYELALDPGISVGLAASLVNAQGPALNYTTACVSSSVAIGEAAEAIRRDDADVVYAGGAHSMIHPFGITGFCKLSTLSSRNEEPTKASRPFDRDRDGFVVGEGGVVLVLEDLGHAQQRGAEILGELTGYGSTDDAYRITDPEPSGRSASRCMSAALENAQLNPEQIDYINAHGSGTVINDKIETQAIKRAFRKHAHKVPVSSTKSMTGHLTTACGAIELLACLMAIREGIVPPTINYETPDPQCDLDYVPNSARDLECEHVLSNSLGFGGQNVALVVSRFDG